METIKFEKHDARLVKHSVSCILLDNKKAL